MSKRYGIAVADGRQTGSEDSFVGGKPKLPAGVQIPECALCGETQTFFIQLAFPSDHEWAEHSVAVFACTSCADENYLIPEMLPESLPGAQVSAAFLATYQKNFRVLVIETQSGRLSDEYDERVRFHPVRIVPGAQSSLGHVGGDPSWLLTDETPGSLAASPPVFLVQLNPSVQFETVVGAPHQREIGLDGTPESSPDSFYRLFVGNATYVFGAQRPSQDAVYVVTQVV
jgi:hypothetical protein